MVYWTFPIPSPGWIVILAIDLPRTKVGKQLATFQQDASSHLGVRLANWRKSAKSPGWSNRSDADGMDDLAFNKEALESPIGSAQSHRSAYQKYEPNLPVVGYLHVTYESAGTYVTSQTYVEPDGKQIFLGKFGLSRDGTSKTLSFEIGKMGNELRFVNYIPVGEQKLPEGPVDGLVIREHIEKLADGTSLQTDVITNPGSLISAHLANEEIRQRDLERETTNIPAIQGRITSVENDGETVCINLGTADGMRPGVRFGVFGSGFTRGEELYPKTMIQVVETISSEKHLSKCMVVVKKSANSIRQGDWIYSPSWQPGTSVSFALIGKMDMDGDDHDDRDQVKEMIEEAGGQVGLDVPPSGKIPGELNYLTRWLVVGESINEIDGADPFLAKAKEIGISRIRYNKLMEWLRPSGARNEEKQQNDKPKGRPSPRFQKQ